MVASEAAGSTLSQAVTNEASPGRWVGGLVGALVCLGLIVFGEVLDSGAAGSARHVGFLRADSFQGLGLSGLPIAFLGGRTLLPDARSGGWKTALGYGLLFGVLAPPLGAIEIVGGLMVSEQSPLYSLYFLPIALVYSYVVAVVTIPCGLAWALFVRAIPESALRRLEVPAPLARLGARHAILVAVVVWVAAMVRPYVA